MKTVVLILSGGMDSATLLYDLKIQGYRVHALSFDYGQKHRRELACARTLASLTGTPHKVLDLRALHDVAASALTREDLAIPGGYYQEESMKQTVVPNRNMALLSLAVSWAITLGAQYVAYGAHSGDHTIYPDCRPAFIESMRKAIALCDWNPPELIVPYMNLSKQQILEKGHALGVPYRHTWTCYQGGEKACGTCGSCTERLEAFERAGLVDPLEYETRAC
jgi:7-cyano-7-deazaguanine synthase